MEDGFVTAVHRNLILLRRKHGAEFPPSLKITVKIEKGRRGTMICSIWKKAAALLLGTAMVFAGMIADAFSDTAASNAENEIAFIANYGIMKGYEDGSFYPDNAITRAEMVAVALRMIRLDSPAADNVYGQSFTDVPKEHWAYGAVETASALGIINGYPDGTFLPEKPVTYQGSDKNLCIAFGLRAGGKGKGRLSAGIYGYCNKREYY